MCFYMYISGIQVIMSLTPRGITSKRTHNAQAAPVKFKKYIIPKIEPVLSVSMNILARA